MYTPVIKFAFIVCFVQCFLFSATLQAAEPAHLKTEYASTPLGIDVTHPRFSWQMHSDKRNSHQKAYQITVTDESGKKMWDSGKTPGSSSLNIKYAGSPLQPATRYHWQVKVWDQNNKSGTTKSWFETGLMNPNPDLSAWSGAQWIGGGDEDLVLYASYLPVFRINYSIRLDEASQSTKASFVYGANDPRLGDQNKNLLQLENPKDSSYLSVELDISPLQAHKNAQLHLYRAGYHPQDRRDIPYKSYDIPQSLIHETNKYDVHTVQLHSSLGYTYLYINGTEKENCIAEVNLNPLGRGGDFIAFPVVAQIGFSVPRGQTAFFSQVEVCNFRDPARALFTDTSNASFCQTLFSQGGGEWTGASYRIHGEDSDVFLTASPDRNSMPMLRTTFSTASPQVTKARLYVTARGIYEIYMNGKRIGEDYFNPGLTQYNKTHLYQTYDVTEYIRSGKNAMGAILGEGWWSGGATYMGEFWNFFGDRQSLLAKLILTYSDGKEETITTQPNRWTYCHDGPVVYSSFFQGEVYDASKDALIEGWSTPGFDDSGWKKATAVNLTGHTTDDERNRAHNIPPVSDYSAMVLTGQFGETVQKIKELTAVSVEEVRPGVFVYDMGQNMAGVPKLFLSGMAPGKEIVLRFAEVKYPDLPEYKDLSGMIMLENIRAAMAQDLYITKGGNEVINPRFTLHGYRFLEITGISEPLPLEAVRGEVLSSIHELASSYETSNAHVNKLWENITWSMYANFLSIPTDCPQRNERLGWGGDISVFGRTATYLSDVSQFLRRHLLALRDVQREDGRFPDVAPLGGGFGGILWGSAGITVPWESYQQYGDKDLLEEHYEAMTQYIEFLQRYVNPETGIFSEGRPTDWGYLGDWLSPEDSKNDKSLLWEAYFIYDLELLQKIATVLGKKDDAERFGALCLEKKAFFNRTYIDPQTGETIHSSFIASQEGKPVGTQVSYVLPLVFHILSEENQEKALQHLIATLTREGHTDYPPYSLLTGFMGTAWITKTLSDYGRSDVAYRLFQQTSYPSWLYSVEQGATTIWERLNSYTHTNGFGGNNHMNSFNHYSFGAIGAWMYNYSLGIERDENSPGFQHFILQPEPDPTGEMTRAKGHYDSMYGRIESSWELKNESYQYQFTVPSNTTATLYLKASSEDRITEQGKPLSASKNVKYLKKEEEKQVFLLQPGTYDIRVKE